MNYLEARELKGPAGGLGTFHFTSMNDGRIWPVGYCAGWKEETREELIASGLDEHLADMLLRDREKARKFQEKYHTHGHATREEAAACYREFLLDQQVRYGESTDTQHRCEVKDCGTWTQGFAQVGAAHAFYLCASHRTREVLEDIYPTIHKIWSS